MRSKAWPYAVRWTQQHTIPLRRSRGVTGWRQYTLTAACGSGPRGRGRPPVLRRWENQRMLSSLILPSHNAIRHVHGHWQMNNEQNADGRSLFPRFIYTVSQKKTKYTGELQQCTDLDGSFVEMSNAFVVVKFEWRWTGNVDVVVVYRQPVNRLQRTFLTCPTTRSRYNDEAT